MNPQNCTERDDDGRDLVSEPDNQNATLGVVLDMPTESSDLRLVRLYAAEQLNSPVICDLITVDREAQNHVPFIALSYVAHDSLSSSMSTIFFNGADLKISEVLDDGLRHLRRIDGDIHLWIDPLCTTESEPGDPMDVIKGRSSVYTAADRVLICLGGGRKEFSTIELGAVSILTAAWSNGETFQYVRSHMELLQAPPVVSGILRFSQLLFRRPWWHWERIGALLDLEIGSKVSFYFGENLMTWDTFVSIVRMLRFVLPRFHANYPIWLDQILLQIPGKIPEAFREIFSFEIKGSIETEETTAWGFGRLFSHPQDILYWISNTSEQNIVGRVLTRLSTRLCNRYRVKSEEKLNRDIQTQHYNISRDDKGPQNEPNSQEPGTSCNDSEPDVALETWLKFLIRRATLSSHDETRSVLQYTLSLVHSQGPDLATRTFQQNVDGPYSYRPLKAGTKEIRVMILHPNRNAEAELQCDLFTLDCEFLQQTGVESFPYMALSYTWGDPNPPRFIYLGGKQKKVTLNLYNALLEFRDALMPMLLWVDAVCIDQDSIDEKNHQVNMMDDIYRNAGCVLIRLDDQPRFMPLLGGDYTLNVMGGLSLFERSLFSRPEYIAGHYNIEDQPELKKRLQAMRGWQFAYALKKFFERSYWTRVWTMQEALLGHNVLICYGGYTVYLKTLLLMYSKLYGEKLPLTGLSVTEEDANTLATIQFLKIYGDTLCGKSPSLFEALIISRERHATVKQDHIYGILGIVERDANKNLLTVDYKSGLFAASRDVFWHIYNMEGSLDILSACELRHHYETDPAPQIQKHRAWPSWLPDWSITPLHTRLARSVLFAPSSTQHFFKAGGNTVPIVRMLEDKTLLSIHGVIVDQIEWVDDEVWAHNFRESRAKACWARFSDMAQSKNLYGNSKRRLRAFQKTISLGQPIIDVDLFEADIANDDIGDEHNNDVLLDMEEEKGEERFFDEKLSHDSKGIMKFHNNQKCIEYISRFFITRSGYIGRGPISTRYGDLAVIFSGAKVPTVLRKSENTNYYIMMGECYIHGIMEGAFMEREEIKSQEFILQ